MALVHERPGLRANLYQPLSAADIKRIADAAFEVLAKSGVAVHSSTALEALAAAGAQVNRDTGVATMPRSFVEDAIAANPSSVTLYSRDAECDAVLEDSRVHYGTGGTAIYVLDPDSGQRRPSTIADVILNARMVDALEYIHVFTINVFPNEIEETDDIDVNRFFHSLDHTTKHVMGGVYSLSGCKDVVRMAEMIAGSPARLRERPFVSFITLIISPFKIDGHYGEMTCYLADQNLPVVMPTEPLCGLTAPITLAGNILTCIAETLAGIALVQSVRPGAPGICGSVAGVPNPATMDHVAGNIERAIINAAVAQLAQHFEIPLYSTAGTTDAKSTDVQATYESAMSTLLVAMSGANYIHDIAGLMEADLTVGYEKLVIDNEILGMTQRVLRGVEVNDDTLGVDMLIEKGPGQDYLAEDHTVRYMRSEFFVPKLANRDKRERMRQDDDAMGRAKAFVRQMRSTEPSACLNEPVRREILESFPAIRQA